MRTTSFIQLVAVNLVVGICLLLAIELAFRLAEKKYWTAPAFRLTRPEPYKASPFFSRAFIDESFDQPKEWFVPTGTKIVLPHNYRGRFFNVIDNIRHTVGHNASPTNHLYIVGGSTVYDSEVPDEYTIASQLQKLINSAMLNINVVNLGVTSVHSAQQLERLQRYVKLKKNDIVIFYDGVNDVVHRFFDRNLDWQIPNTKIQAITIRIIRGLARRSAFFRWFNETFATKKTFPFDKQFASKAADDYVAAIKVAHNYVTSRRAIFYHFLQPTLATKKPKDAYERKLMKTRGEMIPVGLMDVFEKSYPVIRERFLPLPYNYDLSDAFDDFTVSPYLDFCHVNEVADKRIAGLLFETIEHQFQSKSR